MNSIINKDGKCVGQILHIKDTTYCARTFTKFYNLANQDISCSISVESVSDLIKMSKYKVGNNKLYVDDLKTGQTVFKGLNIGSYAVFSSFDKKLYILNKRELNKYLKDNNYKSEVTINFVLGIEEEDRFSTVRVVLSNNLDNAKKLYKERYNIAGKEPVFIGLEEDNYLYILTDRDTIVSHLEQDILIG